VRSQRRTVEGVERRTFGEEHVARARRVGTSIHVRAGIVAARDVAAYVRKG
jgi:hypothetical protein